MGLPVPALEAPGIWVVGLGPGGIAHLTLGALETLRAAARIYCRTLVHPTIVPLRALLPAEARLESFDERYERAGSFDELYAGIVEDLLATARAHVRPIAYAVPGHPLIGERSVLMLRERAVAAGVSVAIVDGLSFLEPLAGAVNLDVLAEGGQLLDAARLLDEPGDPITAPWRTGSPRLAQTGRPLIIGQVYNRRAASACKLWLLERYPGEHEVLVVRDAGGEGEAIRRVPLAELDHSSAFDHLTSLVVPPLDPLLDTRGLAALPYIAARLRAPDGCAWDRRQTLDSLKPHLVEEAYEAVAALDAGDGVGVAEELGDVLLLVVMLAQIGEESGQFELPGILETVTGKLIRRHPHVFGDLRLGDADAVVRNWERLKADERSETASVLDGVPASMPALIASQVMQRKAAALGFEWESVEGVYAKLEEELAEVRAAALADRLEEVGDLIFVAVSLCRHLGLDAEEALRRANLKFRARFEHVERLCAARGIDLAALDAAGLDALWHEAKAATNQRL